MSLTRKDREKIASVIREAAFLKNKQRFDDKANAEKLKVESEELYQLAARVEQSG